VVASEPRLSPALETPLAVARQWLDKITAASTNPTLDLRNLRAVLINLLDIIERDAAIDEAVDRVSEAAAAYLEEVERAAAMQTESGDRAVARRLNAVEMAFAGLRTALARAKPSAHGREQGVLW
jgi:hypothetical protein